MPRSLCDAIAMTAALYPNRRVLWLPLHYPYRVPAAGQPRCCGAMTAALAFACDQHDDPFACADAHIVYHEPFDEYGIPVHDGGASYVLIRHCPWCGASLPDSQRDRWFDELEAKGIEPEDRDNIPPEFLSSAWRAGIGQTSKET